MRGRRLLMILAAERSSLRAQALGQSNPPLNPSSVTQQF